MSNRIYVATRKGLITLARGKDARWHFEQTDFLGDPVTMVLPDARDGRVYAALRLGHFGPKLRRTHDGKSWEECATPTFAPAAAGAPKAASVDQIWSLEAGGRNEPRTLWAGTIPGALFCSRDGGDSWMLIESLWDRPERKEWFGGGYDQPGIHSICVDPRDARRVAIALSCGGVWVTADAGANWQVRAQGMRAAYMPPERAYEPNVQDPHRLVQCPANPDVYWVQHHNGIFRSTDGAASWHEMTHVKPSAFGFAVAVHPRDPDTAWFVPAVKDECRVPVDEKLVVTRTRDGGKSFEVLYLGLPQDHAYDLVYRHGLDVDASGNRLAMGSTTGNLWLSENEGDSWQSLGAHLPPIYAVRFGA
ncbi:MAG TPA: exo-alpha-sialidase [Candidatus Methylomirabilis sp.]|nr:exo-alpha-sialidase [Candidatus Methylomirabilis sp.]